MLFHVLYKHIPDYFLKSFLMTDKQLISTARGQNKFMHCIGVYTSRHCKQIKYVVLQKSYHLVIFTETTTYYCLCSNPLFGL